MLVPVVLLQPGFEVPTMASAILWLVVGQPVLLDWNLARLSSPFLRRNGECAVPLSIPVPCLMSWDARCCGGSLFCITYSFCYGSTALWRTWQIMDIAEVIMY